MVPLCLNCHGKVHNGINLFTLRKKGLAKKIAEGWKPGPEHTFRMGDEKETVLRELYFKGVTLREIAENFGVSEGTIERFTRENRSVYKPRRKDIREIERLAIPLLTGGQPKERVAAEIGVSVTTILRIARRNDIAGRRHRKFSAEDMATLDKFLSDGKPLAHIAKLMDRAETVIHRHKWKSPSYLVNKE